MKTKFFAVIGILALLTAMLPATVSASTSSLKYKPVDVGPRLREMGPSDVMLNLDGFEEAYAAASSSNSSQPNFYGVGDVKVGIWYDDTAGLYLAEYEVRAIGDHIEVWVMTDLNFPDGDPRNPVVVTQEQIDYLVEEFDNNIYPNTEGYFGAADFHDGSAAALPFDDYYDPEGRTIAMISNIGDESYHDPTYPNYIAGFYWGSVFELYLDRNVISIDAFDWANRVGPDAARPYLYEGVFAHEYQHLLHDDYDSDEVNFVNEGLSMFTEFYVGYAVGNNDAYSTFEALPENSLTAWGDQGGREIVADYGEAFLWYMYMWENYGDAFIQDHFLNLDNDISGINSSLANIGSTDIFDEIFHDFAIATVMDSGDYKFENHEVNLNLGTKGNPNPDAFASPGAPPWGSDYYVLGGVDSLVGFEFNGVRFNPDWTSDGDVLYSGDGDLLDSWAIFEATGGGTLTFDTYWDIEDYWDFGLVQISIDGGATWMSLEGDYTTYVYDPAAHPDIIANLPGLTSWSCFITTDNGCWINLSYDLSAYSGDILLAFRYMTDWGTTYEGWFVDNVYVDDTLISDGSSVDNFMSYAEFMGIENKYTVTLIGERNVKGKTQYAVETILEDGYTGSFDDFKYILDDYNTVYMLVRFDAAEGTTSYADYSFDFLSNAGKPFKNKVR